MTIAGTDSAALTSPDAKHRGLPATKARRRWFQFSLRTILLLPIAVAALWFIYIRPFSVQQQVATFLQNNSGTVATRAGGPKWLHRGANSERFQDVVHVDLADAQCSQECLDQLLRLPRLKSLILGGEGFADTHLLRLQALSSLEILILDTTSVSDRGIAELKVDLPKLLVRKSSRRALAMINARRGGVRTQATGAMALRNRFGEDHFREAVNYICFSDPDFGDDEMALLKYFPNATTFTLSQSSVSNAALRHLSAISKLRRVSLAGQKDTNSINTEQIDSLGKTRITSRGLVYLGDLADLETLRLRKIPFDDRDLSHLQNLPKLTSLELISVEISDAGLGLLSSMTQLKELKLVSTSVPADGIERLKQALPNCSIN